ncbi:MAG: sodium/proline symporter [candidate division Zixibacteria bacterium]|nr:sodium/proline symporter [candidate division Zixibacteria bacterium]MBU1472028.1 sodium/proline symporter [candidate division Zixibacteria bacterium]MBU2624051.1 sodium/proline symporter [candidate division Zixibacteria bacterium]
MDPTLIGFLLYLLTILIVGVITVRFTHTLADYIIAGRRLGAWVVAFSERASGESAWLLIGLPGLAWASGFSALWPAVGCTFGILFSWVFIARRLRISTEEYSAITLPDYFEARFGDDSHLLRVVSTLVIVFFFTMYVAAQFLGAGKVLNATFGISHIWGMVIGAVIILFYTILGGFFAVAWTDLFQGILMVGTLVCLPVLALVEIGGFGALADKLTAINPALVTITEGKSGWEMWSVILGGLAIGLGYMGQPHLVTRFMAIRDPKDLKKGSFIAVIWALLAFWGAVLIGILALGLYGTGFEDQEQVMPFMTNALFPAWIAGILISGAIAAMMSTADSQLLVSTSAISEDIYHQMIDSNASQRLLVTISRIATFVVAVIAFVLALSAENTVYKFVLYAWAGLGASFGPALLLSLWWKSVSRWGVLAGMISGTLTVVLWKSVFNLSDYLYELIPGFFVALMSIIVVTLVAKKKPRSD